MFFTVIYSFKTQPNQDEFINNILIDCQLHGYQVQTIDLRYYVSNPCNISIKYNTSGNIKVIDKIPGSNYCGSSHRIFEYGA